MLLIADAVGPSFHLDIRRFGWLSEDVQLLLVHSASSSRVSILLPHGRERSLPDPMTEVGCTETAEAEATFGSMPTRRQTRAGNRPVRPHSGSCAVQYQLPPGIKKLYGVPGTSWPRIQQLLD
jgi:hypothetical protein